MTEADALLEFPAEDSEEVQDRLFTHFRNREIRSRFEAFRSEGCAWKQAVRIIVDDDRYIWPER